MSHPGAWELHLPREPAEEASAATTFPFPAGQGAASEGLKALKEHVASQAAQDEDVGQRDDQVGFTQQAEDFDGMNAHVRPDEAPREQNSAHLEVHIPEP